MTVGFYKHSACIAVSEESSLMLLESNHARFGIYYIPQNKKKGLYCIPVEARIFTMLIFSLSANYTVLTP